MVATGARTARAFAATVILLLGVAGRAYAQPTPGATAEPEWIRPEAVATQAEGLLRRLSEATATSSQTAEIQRIETSLNELMPTLDAGLRRAAEAVERSVTPAQLEDVRRELTGVAAPLGPWRDALESEANRVAQVLDEIARGQHRWSLTRARPETIAAGDVVARRVESSVEALEGADAHLRAWRAGVLALSDRVIDRLAAVEAALKNLRAASASERASLLVPDHPPLWSRGLFGKIRQELPRVPAEIGAYAESTNEYIRRDPRPLVVQALLAGLLMLAFGRLCAHARARIGSEASTSRSTRLLELPYSTGLLLAVLATPVFHPLAPRRFTQLAAILALFPAARILMHVSERAHLVAFVGAFVLLLLDRAATALQPLPGIERLTFLLLVVISLGLAIWFSRRVRAAGGAPALRLAADVAVLGLAVAVVAEIGGWTNLAALIGRGIAGSAIAGLYVYAATIAVSAVLAYGFASTTARRSHLLGRNPALVQRRTEGILRWIGAGVWIYFLLTALGLRSTANDALSALLGAGVTLGALSLSIGGVLGFLLTLLGAVLLARLVTGVLEADVYPRTRLPRGVPYVLSTLLRYGFYSLGFLFALGAAGVQLGQMALMLGGLGVGVGLGLQDLVKNFAAGLTLLLERRVQVGDVLEMPNQGIFGRVLSIGSRASIVRGWNGAEVVVPNADLISSAVTNWTLSDRLCRIEVPVGVAYGSDPDQVIRLLLDAARSYDQLLGDPAPQAYLRGFGESSLDFELRAWTDQGYDQKIALTSELALAVHRVLRDAGIAIPFPQRDLHLTISPEAGAAIAATAREE